MFNLYPGQGLGFSASREIAFGLNPIASSIIPIPIGGGSVVGIYRPREVVCLDNGYSIAEDDNEVAEVITIILGVV